MSRSPQKEKLPVEDVVAAGTQEARAVTNGHSTTTDEAPRGREAVLRILMESSREWRQRDLVEEIKRRGWINPEAKDPDAAVRVAARRLVGSGEVIKVRTGVYRRAGIAMADERGAADQQRIGEEEA